MLLNLSPDEERLILENRAKKLGFERKLRGKLLILQISFEYERWLQENGAGSTYSTFCDDFGYSGSEIFKKVEEVRKLAHSLEFDDRAVPQ